MDDDAFLQTTMPALDLVYNIARRVVPRGDDAEDLVQETYLAAWGAWRRHRRPRKVEPWLATICLNIARSSYRRRARRPSEVPWDEASPLRAPDDPASEAVASVEREAVHRALSRLSDEHRLAIALVDLAGLSTAEAARVLGIPRGTVLSRLHRGRKALAAALPLLAVEPDRSEDLGP